MKRKIERIEWKDVPQDVRGNVTRLIVAIKNWNPDIAGMQFTVENFAEKPPTIDLKIKVDTSKGNSSGKA